MLGMYIKQPGFTDSAYGLINKNKEKIGNRRFKIHLPKGTRQSMFLT